MDLSSGYKQTEVGVIPEDWEVKSVHEFAAIKTGPFGTLLKAAEYSDSDGVPLISVGEIRAGFLKITDHTPRVPETVVRRLPQYILKKGDIVFGRKGAVERSALIREEHDGWFLGSDGISIRPSKECHCEYLAFQFQSHRVKAWLIQNAIGTTMASLNQEILKKVVIPLPSTKREQEAIAEALSDADGLIESLEQLIAKKRQIKQGAMQDLLRPKEGWKERQLGNTAVLKARIGWQGLTTAEYLETGDYYLVTGTDFKGGYIDWSNCHFVDELRYKQDKNIQLKQHDVLVTKDGTIGKVALINHLDRPATLNSGVFVIRPIQDAFLPSFFYYLMCSSIFSDFLKQLSAGSTINHLYQKDFVNFVYKTPSSISEQEEFASTLANMDAEIVALETKLDKARQLKQGMMDKLLTGQIRLPEPAISKVKRNAAISEKSVAATIPNRTHSWAFHEAVIISVLAEQFGSAEFPLGRKRCTKLSYLIHRKTDQKVQGYLKKAAGPYNPRTRYAGPEKIAQENGYVRNHQSGKFHGFIAAEKIAQAKTYFAKWYDPKITAWLEQFRFKSNDELECLATVDMAMQELLKQNKTTDVDNVRALIASEPDWLPKLDRSAFSDSGIAEAIAQCHVLFG
jgi:type I restriction enzyme S subunit